MSKILKISLTAALLLGLACLTVWATLTLWYRLPFGLPLRLVLSGGFALLGLAVSAALFGHRRLRALATFCLALASVTFWWSTLTPPADANWAPEVTGRIEGEIPSP